MMTDTLVISFSTGGSGVPLYAPPEGGALGVFDLIEHTAELVRALQHRNDFVEAREREAEARFMDERATWREDLQTLLRTVEESVHRTMCAETELVDAKLKAQLAIQLCKESQKRELDAVARAEAAEQRVRRLELLVERLEQTPALATPVAPPKPQRKAAPPARSQAGSNQRSASPS